MQKLKEFNSKNFNIITKLSDIEGCNPICKACKHKNKNYKESIAQKNLFAKNKLAEFGIVNKLIAAPAHRIIGYRNKVLLRTQFNEFYNWDIGLQQNLNIIPITNCPVQSTRTNSIVKLFVQYLPKSTNFPLAFLYINSKQIVLVFKSNQIPKLNWLNEQFIDNLALLDIDAIWLHLNPSTGKKVFNKTDWKLIYGKEFSLNTENLFYGPITFQQLIPEMIEIANNETINFFSCKKDDVFLTCPF